MTGLLAAWQPQEGARRVTGQFTATFGDAPAGVWSAPGRVNLIGEHTDYNDGLCLPIALPHRTFVAVRPRTDRRLRLVSAQEPGTRELDLGDVGPVGGPGEVRGWPAYVAGVAWAMAQEGLLPAGAGADVAVDSCVPYGAGLSSSAALECAVAVALADLHGAPLDEPGRARLAALCVRAENEVAGAPTGGMDQAAALRCRAGHALLLDCRDGATEQVPFDLARAGLELLVIDTRAEHQLADGQYAERRRRCETAAEHLGVPSLRAVTDLPEALGALSDEAERAAVRHVVGEIDRTEQFVQVLRSGPLDGAALRRAGQLMHASHTSLRDDYAVSCAELDVAVAAATDAGAHGARMTGGGFGGSAIALISAGSAATVAAEVRAAFAVHGFAEPAFLLATAADPAGRVEVANRAGRSSADRPDDDAAQRLTAERDRTVARLAALENSRADIVAAAAGANTDDEHDPEGATIGFERAHVQALATRARQHLAAVEEALARVADGTYGRCERCGRPIAPARLAARPTATTCISCA